MIKNKLIFLVLIATGMVQKVEAALNSSRNLLKKSIVATTAATVGYVAYEYHQGKALSIFYGNDGLKIVLKTKKEVNDIVKRKKSIKKVD